MEDNAVIGALVAFGIAAILTPLVARLAKWFGATDPLKKRGLARNETPLLGGIAIFFAFLISALIFIPLDERQVVVILAATFVLVFGVIDDLYDLNAGLKFCGQLFAASGCVAAGIRVDSITLPFIHHVDFGWLGVPLTILGLVTVINVVNFSDGADGLAAGVCAISAAAMAIIAFDLGKGVAGVLAAVVAGAAVGFLVHNFHPASVFMGDSGSNLLGLLLGVIMVEGSVKTNALIALFVPLLVLAVPFLDTGFVIAKRIKNRRPVYYADAHHFHHRFHRMGFSQRKTVIYLYIWTLIMAGLAIAMRFIPYTDGHGHFRLGGSIAMGACFVFALVASIYLIYVLEILKLRGARARQVRKMSPETSEHEIDSIVERELVTGEFKVTSFIEDSANDPAKNL